MMTRVRTLVTTGRMGRSGSYEIALHFRTVLFYSSRPAVDALLFKKLENSSSLMLDAR